MGWKFKKPKLKLPKIKKPNVKKALLSYKKKVDSSVKKNFGEKSMKKLQKAGASAAKDFKQGKIISGTLKTVSVGTKITGSGTVGAGK